jgi:hypothetical protein
MALFVNKIMLQREREREEKKVISLIVIEVHPVTCLQIKPLTKTHINVFLIIIPILSSPHMSNMNRNSTLIFYELSYFRMRV